MQPMGNDGGGDGGSASAALTPHSTPHMRVMRSMRLKLLECLLLWQPRPASCCFIAGRMPQVRLTLASAKLLVLIPLVTILLLLFVLARMLSSSRAFVVVCDGCFSPDFDGPSRDCSAIHSIARNGSCGFYALDTLCDIPPVMQLLGCSAIGGAVSGFPEGGGDSFSAR